MDDAIGAVALFEPTEPDETGDCLVHAFARGADHAGKFLLSDWKCELVGSVGQLEEPFRGTAGHIEKDRVGQRFVCDPDALGK